MCRSLDINKRKNNAWRQIARSASTMRTTTFSVTVRCVCVLLILHGLVFNVSASGGRILFGNAANPADYKFMLNLLYPDDSTGVIWHCSGSVISNNFILTGAHCLHQKECTLMKIYPSNWARNDDPKYFAEQCYIHEHFNQINLENDIALVRTRENLLANNLITKIDLPDPGTVYEPGTMARIAGWGQMENQQYANTLMHATVRVFDWELCNQVFKNTEQCENTGDCRAISEHAFCTMGDAPNPPGTCIGDSGGPVIIAGRLAGLVSAVILVEDICEIGTPSLHIKVADYIPWIRKYVDF